MLLRTHQRGEVVRVLQGQVHEDPKCILRRIFAALGCVTGMASVPRARASRLDLNRDPTAFRYVAGEHVGAGHVSGEGYGVATAPVDLRGDIQLPGTPDLLRIHRPFSVLHGRQWIACIRSTADDRAPGRPRLKLTVRRTGPRRDNPAEDTSPPPQG